MPAKKPKKDWSAINKQIKNRKTKYKADERIFVPAFNDKNQAKVTMRFLDSRDTDMPYETQYNHFFNDVGGWFITTCPSSIGENCPCCEDLYANNYYETDNDLYYERKKSTSYYTNVLIVDDVNNPTNNGKVFLFKYGIKIMEKIDDAIEDSKLPWDEDTGVNFVFSAKKKGKMTNYDASYFSDSETSLDEYTKDVEALLETRHELAGFTDASEYTEYSALKAKYLKVIGEEDSAEDAKPARTRKTTKTDVVEDEVIIEDEIDDVDGDGDVGDESMYDESEDDESFFDDIEDEDED